MNTGTLHRHAAEGIGLDTAAAALPGAVGYLFSPAAFVLARVSAAGQLETHGAWDFSQVYEARLATAGAELRWLRDPADGSGRGRAAVVSESVPDLAAPWQALAPLKFSGTLETPLLLTALAAGPAGDGWLEVNAPRQGTFRIPWADEAPPRQGRLAWRWREYLGPAAGAAGDDGNVTIVAARLAGLMVAEEMS